VVRTYEIDIRKNFFVRRVVKHWNSMPRKLVAGQLLETFKVRLDEVLSNLIKLKLSLLTAGGLG